MKRRIFLAILLIAIATGVTVFLFWKNSIQPAGISIEDEKAALDVENTAPFRAVDAGDIEYRQEGVAQYTSLTQTTALVHNENRFYIGTAGGLVVLDSKFSPTGIYTTTNGLPGNHVTALAVHDNMVFAAFKEAGIARIDGTRVRVFEFAEEADKNVTSLVSAGDSLYIGTFGNGVMRFDGVSFSREINGLPGADFKNVSALAQSGGLLAVGTHENGLFVQTTFGFAHYGSRDGLPADNIFSVSWSEPELIVSTSMGAAVIDSSKRVTPLGEPEVVSDVLIKDDMIFTATVNGGVKVSGGFTGAGLEGAIKVNDLVDDDYVWALTDAGAYYLEGREWMRLELPAEKESGLPGNYITAIETDSFGRTWIGTFENGIVVLNSGGDIEKTIKDNVCREINALVFDPERNKMLAATNQGLLVFNTHFEQKKFTADDGLISNVVTSILLENDRTIATTAAGVTMLGEDSTKSFYAFHGLVSNRVYSSAEFDGEIYLGTLGGVSVMSGGRVTKSFTAADSSLPANWITALASGSSKLYIGTYGGGIAVMKIDGSIEQLKNVPADLEVNFNAMIFEPPYLLAGTLRHGLIIFNTETGGVLVPEIRFGSRNVTALESDGKALYVGTDSGLTVIKSKEFLFNKL